MDWFRRTRLPQWPNAERQPRIKPIPAIDYLAWGDYGFSAPGYGATVASVPTEEHFITAPVADVNPVDAQLRNLLANIEALADSTFVCECCVEGEPLPDFNTWGDDAQKQAALAIVEEILLGLPDYGQDFQALVDRLNDLEAVVLHAGTTLAEPLSTSSSHCRGLASASPLLATWSAYRGPGRGMSSPCR